MYPACTHAIRTLHRNKERGRQEYLTKKQDRADEAAIEKVEMAQEREKQMANALSRVESKMKVE